MTRATLEQWCAFADGANAAPDSRMTAAEFAARYERFTGEQVEVSHVEWLMDYEPAGKGHTVATLNLGAILTKALKDVG